MDVNEVQEKLKEFADNFQREVQRFNDLTGTVIQIDLSYINREYVGAKRPSYTPSIRATAKIP